MKDLRFFEKEFEMIQDEDLKMTVKAYFDEKVPAYFWFDGASSSGKYHPQFSQKVGGLVRHTKAVVRFAEELCRAYDEIDEADRDYIIVACLIHDTIKYGFDDEIDTKFYKNHAENSAEAFRNFALNECDLQIDECVYQAIKRHMGKWGKDKPETLIDNIVHLADYVASRNFIDIPEIIQEYEEVNRLTDVIFYYGNEGESS